MTTIDDVYNERNRVVAAFARAALTAGYECGVGDHRGAKFEPGWNNVVVIELPHGQVTWHFHDREADLFSFLRRIEWEYDGHSTEEKYKRLEAWARDMEDVP